MSNSSDASTFALLAFFAGCSACDHARNAKDNALAAKNEVQAVSREMDLILTQTTSVRRDVARVYADVTGAVADLGRDQRVDQMAIANLQAQVAGLRSSAVTRKDLEALACKLSPVEIIEPVPGVGGPEPETFYTGAKGERVYVRIDGLPVAEYFAGLGKE